MVAESLPNFENVGESVPIQASILSIEWDRWNLRLICLDTMRRTRGSSISIRMRLVNLKESPFDLLLNVRLRSNSWQQDAVRIAAFIP